MVSGVLLGLFIIPVLFVIFQHLQERITGIPVNVLNDGDIENYNRLNGESIPSLEEENV